jgi:hypothetical protein
MAVPPPPGNAGPSPAVFQDCIMQLSDPRNSASPSPANPPPAWDIQTLELAVYVALAIILAASSVWAVRRHLS